MVRQLCVRPLSRDVGSMAYVDSLLIMEDDDDDDDDSGGNNFEEESEETTPTGMEVHSLHSGNRNQTGANADTVKPWLKKLKTNAVD